MTKHERIFEAAMYVAKRHGLHALTRARVAAQASTSVGAVSLAFGDMPQLVDAVVRRAIRNGVPEIIGQAVAVKHPATEGLDRKTKLDALKALA